MTDPEKAGEIDKNPSVLSMTMTPPQIVNASILHASSSSAGPAVTMGYTPYPPPLATYPELVANPKLFSQTLQKLHAAMGTKFMTPIIGGRDLDLHRLFVEVTNRGGIEKVLRDKKWKEVTATFNFPSTATNASFILRKHYFSLLHHYEQIYYFQAQGWAPIPHAIYQAGYATPIAIHGGTNRPPVLPLPLPLLTPMPNLQQQVIRHGESVPQGATTASSVNSIVTGVIDGKFDGGYLVTVTIGDRKLSGVLYHSAQVTAPMHQNMQAQSTETHPSKGEINATSVMPPIKKLRRRRRKKSEMRRDPAHPKANISGYNFFFAEQHPKLKPLYHGREKEIGRIIGELWTNLKEDEKTVYQEKAVIDKERYRKEMEEYREKLRLEVISNAVPIQQRVPNSDNKIVEIKDYSETFEDEEDEEEEEDDSMSMSEYEEEDAEEPGVDLNLEMHKKDEVVNKSSNNGVDQSSLQEVAEATLMLANSKETGGEEVGEAQKEEQKEGHDLNAVPEDQGAKVCTE